VVRHRGSIDYQACYAEMRAFTATRSSTTPDELWHVEHGPVFTLGLAARAAHAPQRAADGVHWQARSGNDAVMASRLSAHGSIPVEQVDRGGQVTYHGPGQPVVYCLVDLARRGLAVRHMVRLLEQAVIDVLADRGVTAARETGAPGVYVGGAKVAALGLRVRRGGCYHGVALNVDVDLAPFAAIDPCGYPGLPVTRTRDLGVADSPDELGNALAGRIAELLENPDVT